MSIDNDARTGAIKADEAKRRRKALERESQLFGAMDGAMKFVKGDAIASLLIIAVNLIGGITIGCVQKGMSVGEAGSTYSLLAIGDGLIAQIPALLVSLTAGLVVTRVGADGASDLGADILNQVSSNPRVLIVAAAILLALGLIPGFPTVVFFALAVAMGAGGWFLQRGQKRREEADELSMKQVVDDKENSEGMQVRLGGDLISKRNSIEKALAALRSEMTDELGITLPSIVVVEAGDAEATGLRLVMNRVPLLSAAITGGEMSGSVAGPDRLLRTDLTMKDKVATGDADALDAMAQIASLTRQTLLRAAGDFIGIQETQVLINRAEVRYGDLVREAMRAAPLLRLAEVFRRLVTEGVSLRDMRQILETVAEWAPRESSAAMLTEYVRIGLRRQICHAAANGGMTLPVLLLEDDLAGVLQSSIVQTIAGDALQPDNAEAVVDLVSRALNRANNTQWPVIVTVIELRRHLREFLLQQGVDVRVMSHSEFAPGFHIEVVGTIGFSDQLPTHIDHDRIIENKAGTETIASPRLAER
jgi:type III secretion protein V